LQDELHKGVVHFFLKKLLLIM